MNRAPLLTSMSVGAGLAYLLDPNSGGRRRARVRDSLAHAAARTRKAVGRTTRDVRNRLYGTAAEIGGALRPAEADDHVLAERVRAALGRAVSHPHAVKVEAVDGVVTLRGPILSAEVPHLLDTVRRVRGVRGVINDLEEHKRPGDVPALQGGAGLRERRVDLLQRQWSPATRLVTGLSGGVLASYGLARRDLPGWLVAAGGLSLVSRAATNLDVRRLTGVGAGRRAVDVQKTITIDAPIEEVFAFWSAYENFPRFMSRVLEVRPSRRGGRSHWTVAGPGGAPVHFDTEVTRMVPDRMLAWRTVEGALVGHAGVVQFEPAPQGGTRVNIRMAYNPPGGWLGHGLASAFGVDPKSSLDEDLVRVKTLIETGRPPHDAARRDAGREPVFSGERHGKPEQKSPESASHG